MTFSAAALLFSTLVAEFAPPVHAQPAPHLPHEGRHGGAFASAATDSVHVEAVWSEQRRLRLFLVRANGDPLELDALRDVQITAAVGGTESAAALMEIDGHFEARIPTLTLPASIGVRLRMSDGAAEELLTFSFDTYSRQIDDIARPSPAEIPDTLDGILKVLEDDRLALRAIFSERNDLTRMLPIEERVRERVLAIDPHLSTWPEARRTQAQSAVTMVMRSCWLLHIVLDFGDRPQVEGAVAQLDDALIQLQSQAGANRR